MGRDGPDDILWGPAASDAIVLSTSFDISVLELFLWCIFHAYSNCFWKNYNLEFSSFYIDDVLFSFCFSTDHVSEYNEEALLGLYCRWISESNFNWEQIFHGTLLGHGYQLQKSYQYVPIVTNVIRSFKWLYLQQTLRFMSNFCNRRTKKLVIEYDNCGGWISVKSCVWLMVKIIRCFVPHEK